MRDPYPPSTPGAQLRIGAEVNAKTPRTTQIEEKMKLAHDRMEALVETAQSVNHRFASVLRPSDAKPELLEATMKDPTLAPHASDLYLLIYKIAQAQDVLNQILDRCEVPQ